jgi:two-component system repressor protein LuxO
MPSNSDSVAVLIVDADPAQRRVLSDHLGPHSGSRFRARACGSADEARQIADAQLVVADIASIGGPGQMARLAGTGRRVIAISDGGSVSAAVEAMRAGAADFIAKPVGQRRLIERLEAAIADWRQTPSPSPSESASTAAFEGFVGQSEAMRAIYDQIERMAASRAPVFLTGESGTGKELCAEAVHRRGGADRPFVAVNCAAIPPELAESELFGHIRGAFTGAVADRAGAAELANGGTLFLDELTEMPLALQPKLLRFVESGSLQRIGDGALHRVDVRIIAATNRDPLAEVAAGRFREDLFYRLNVLPLDLPPLRARPGDIVPLARHFLECCAAEEGRPAPVLDAAAEAFLAVHPWPGNVRQLRNAMRRITVHAQGEDVGFALVRSVLGDQLAERPSSRSDNAAIAPYRDQERRIIETALAAFGGNISRAAAALEINPSTIYRKRQLWRAAG